MAQITLTPKTAKYGVLNGLPLTDVTTICPAINPVYYDASVGTLSPAVTTGIYLIVKVTLQNAVGATVRTLRIVKQDGTLLLQFPATAQPALPLETTTVYSSRVIVTNPSDWVNVKLQVSSGTAGDTVIIKEATLVFAFAELCNITDESLVKRNITNVYFITMQPVQESVLGKVGSVSDTTFLTVPVNGLSTGFRWDTNSGMTLYSWDGSSIGLGV
jgi:hypothetical protein